MIGSRSLEEAIVGGSGGGGTGGATGPGAAERVRLRLGPFGFGVTRHRPALFTIARRNCTELVLTDRRLLGVGRRPSFAFPRHRRDAGRVVFEVPLDAVVSFERADYLAVAALWVRYRAATGVEGVGIEAGLGWHDRLDALETALRAGARGPA